MIAPRVDPKKHNRVASKTPEDPFVFAKMNPAPKVRKVGGINKTSRKIHIR